MNEYNINVHSTDISKLIFKLESIGVQIQSIQPRYWVREHDVKVSTTLSLEWLYESLNDVEIYCINEVE